MSWPDDYHYPAHPEEPQGGVSKDPPPAPEPPKAPGPLMGWCFILVAALATWAGLAAAIVAITWLVEQLP